MDQALLDKARDLGAAESGLAVAIALRPDGSPAASVVNAGVLSHPARGETVVGFVARGRARKLDYLRAHPSMTVVFRSGWDWVAVEGDVELAGPDDDVEGLTPEDLPRWLRAIYAAAVGGKADDWGGLDEEMASEGHTAVLIRPRRVYANPSAR